VGQHTGRYPSDSLASCFHSAHADAKPG